MELKGFAGRTVIVVGAGAGGIGTGIAIAAAGARGSATPDLELERRANPLDRRSLPQDIAGAVLFRLSDLSAWITGQVIVVNGGASVKPSYVDPANAMRLACAFILRDSPQREFETNSKHSVRTCSPHSSRHSRRSHTGFAK